MMGAGDRTLVGKSAGEPRGAVRAAVLQRVHRFLLTANELELQGAAGLSRKRPRPQDASHCVSLPQSQVHGRLRRGASTENVQGRVWFDHEWRSSYLTPGAVRASRDASPVGRGYLELSGYAEALGF